MPSAGLALAVAVAFPFLPAAGATPVPLAPAAPLPVRTTGVEAAAGHTSARVFSGVVHARRTSEVGFQIDGELVALWFDEGERVRAGEPLAELDLRKRRAERARAAARLEEARARLDELVAGPRQQTVAVAEERVRELEERHELAERRRDRRDYLVKERVATEEELDDADTEADALAAQLVAARQELDELREGTRTEALAAQRAVVAQLRAAVESHEVDLSNGVLAAPFDALVAARHFDEGRVIDAGTPVFRLVEDAVPEVRIGLPIDVAAGLAPGEALVLEAGRRPFTGTLRAILPELDASARTATLVIDVDEEGAPLLLPHQVVRLRLESHEPVEGFWVPTAGLTRGSRGLWIAYALSRDADSPGSPGIGRVEARDVEVLVTEGDRALVRGVLREGDLIVAEGLNRIVPGQLVQSAD